MLRGRPDAGEVAGNIQMAVVFNGIAGKVRKVVKVIAGLDQSGEPLPGYVYSASIMLHDTATRRETRA
jgi:hypothetical protein